ncbi:hypothetical protein MRO78_19055, partial [Dickeya dianthicola]|nr:hypothetical protein [Dickeya dianthicola]
MAVPNEVSCGISHIFFLQRCRTHDKERLKRRLSLTTGWEAKLWRCALPSAFAFAVRAARDAFQTRHGLSPR